MFVTQLATTTFQIDICKTLRNITVDVKRMASMSSCLGEADKQHLLCRAQRSGRRPPKQQSVVWLAEAKQQSLMPAALHRSGEPIYTIH